MTYLVLADDSLHHVDKIERYTHGEFDTLEAVVDARRAIVNDHLVTAHNPEMSANDL